ncbi:MAG: mechanosensitive ion channel family protein [Planctomycetes bacterium]|nr:mechanosensitive ion channel family protein [Planctomycetota bacterium]
MGGWKNTSMYAMRWITVLALVTAAGLCTTPARAQNDGTGNQVPVDLPQDVLSASELPLQELRLQLRPLRRDELYGVAETWIQDLQLTSSVLSETELALLGVQSDDQRQTLVMKADALRGVRAGLTDRIEIILEQLQDKGGETEEFEQYIKAVSGVSIEVTDTKTLWLRFTTWVRSEKGGIKIGTNLLKFVVILIVFWILGAILGGFVRRALRSFKKTSSLLRDFLGGLTRKVTVIVGAVIAVSQLGIDVTPLIAAIGAAGLVIGFALQGTLSNFASGIMILLYRPFDVGDAVTAAGISGKVMSMTMVSTVINTFDNQRIIVPNNAIWGGVITNITANPTRRVDMIFGISYTDDIDKARALLGTILNEHPLILPDPEPVIKLHTLGDSSVDFVVRPWSKTSDYWDVYWDVTCEVKKRFDAEGVSIPFPQRDVHLHQVT